MSEDAEARRVAVMARYGSRAAALAPCPRETTILTAVASWRVAQAAPLDRWTDSLAGWFGGGAQHAEAPAHVVTAIRGAYPLPATVAEAAAEHAHWETRNTELGDLLGPLYDAGGGRFLDLPADMRAAIVRELAETDLPARTVDELRARLGFLEVRGMRGGASIAAAMIRDLVALADLPTPGLVFGSDTLRDRIAAALQDEPGVSDRQLAKALGCSDVTIGKARRSLGLSDVARTVRRGGQAYPMQPRGRVAS